MPEDEDRRRRRRGAIIVTLLSIALGAGAATSAVATVLSVQTPDDQGAVLRGPATLVDPASVISYGG